MGLQLQHWVKTVEALELLATSKVFCVGSELYQGWRGAPMSVPESNLSEPEMNNVVDVDDTLKAIWFKRRQRLESSFLRKQNEYDKRKHTLREQEEAIFKRMERRTAMDLQPSEADKAELSRLEDRMVKLASLGQHEEVKRSEIAEKGPVPDAPVPTVSGCDACQADCPEGHKNPTGWLRGHRIHCKVLKAQRAERVEAKVAELEAVAP